MNWHIDRDGMVFRPMNCGVMDLELLVDGNPLKLAIAFDTVEGWADHYVPSDQTGIKLDARGERVVERTRGHVTVRRKTK